MSVATPSKEILLIFFLGKVSRPPWKMRGKQVANFSRLSFPLSRSIALLCFISFLTTNSPAPQQRTHRFRAEHASKQHRVNSTVAAGGAGPFSSRWQTLLNALLLRRSSQLQLQRLRIHLRGGMPLINGVPKTYWEIADEILSRPPLLIYHETAARRREAESLERELVLLRYAVA